MYHSFERNCQSIYWVQKRSEKNDMYLYKFWIPSHLTLLTKIEDMKISCVYIVMKTFLLKCFDNGFSRVMWKIYKKHATNFQPSSPPTIWHTYNFCTEAQPHPSILFQAVSSKTKQHHLAAVFTSLTPLFLIQFFDWPWWNKLPPIIRPWSQRLPPTSKPHPNREKWADDTRIWKTAEHDNITGVWIYGPNRVALQAN